MAARMAGAMPQAQLSDGGFAGFACAGFAFANFTWTNLGPVAGNPIGQIKARREAGDISVGLNRRINPRHPIRQVVRTIGRWRSALDRKIRELSRPDISGASRF